MRVQEIIDKHKKETNLNKDYEYKVVNKVVYAINKVSGVESLIGDLNVAKSTRSGKELLKEYMDVRFNNIIE